MLREANRLKKNKDFDKVFRVGKRINADFLLIKVVNNNKQEPRFGFVISKKISKKSTVRNKIKRILREIVRKRILEIKEGVDVVMVAKKDFSKTPFSDIDNFIYLSFKKNCLLKKN